MNYTIKDLETLSGIKAHTIRIWEKRYGLLKPKRTTSNIRYYNDDELRYLLNIALIVKHGFRISKVSEYDEARLNIEVLKLNQIAKSDETVIDRLVIYMIHFDDEKFEDLLDQQISQLGFENAVLDVVFPLFEKIGIYWQTGSIFPSQEHFVSSLLRQRLISYSAAFRNNEAAQTILFFLPENEMHELSLLFYNYLALKNGYKTIYLGQNVPMADLAKLNDLVRVDYVFTAYLNPMAKGRAEKYFEALNVVFSKKKVFITGAQVMKQHLSLPLNFSIITNLQSFKKYLGGY